MANQLRTSGVFNLGSLGGDTAGGGDADFDSVVLLLDGEGSSITDKSSSPHTITPSGDTQVDTAVKKFGSGSIKFDGTGDYLDVSVDSGLTFDGDFTVEAWVYPDTAGANMPIIDARASNIAYQNYYFGLANVSGTLRTEVILASGATGRTGTTNAVPTGQWSHIAWVRSSGVITTYVNGVADATTKTDSAILTPTNFRIGAAVGTPNAYFDGYLDDIRVTKGVARYTNNFTPPTSDLTNTVPSGTVELRMDGTDGAGSGSTTTDLSSFSHTGITSTDVTAGTTDAGVTRPDLYGGAKGYLDFTSSQAGRIVTLPTTVDLSSGDFTIECWVLFDTISQFRSFMRGGTGSASGTWQLQTYDSKISLLTGGASSYTITDSKTVTTNTWYHVALSYVSNTYTMTLSVDGNCTSLSNQTEFSNMQSSYLGGSGNTAIELGANRGGTVRHDGLLTDVRFTTGAALYPDLGRITPIPTAALPTTGTVAGATRPTRKWGGLVGRSLIVTTTTELTELPHSPSASIYKGDTTQGSQTLSTNGTAPTFSGSGIDSYHTPLYNSYYSYSPATAATAWTAFYDWEMNSANYPYLASYGTTSGAVRRFYTHSNDIKVYKGSGAAAGDFPTMIPSLTDGQRYRAAFRWDGTNLKSYLVSGTAKITALPYAYGTFTQDFDLDGNTHSIGVNSTNFSAAEDLESPLYAYGFYESALTDSQMVDVFNALNNIGSESETLVKTGVLSLAEHYQSKL